MTEKPAQLWTEFWMVRHGQTDWNVEGRIQGRTDRPLNEVGIQQAKNLAEKIKNEKFAAVYSSKKIRAKKTADILAEALGMEVITMDGLEERNLGNWEGMTYPQIQEKYPLEFSTRHDRPGEYAPPNGETVNEMNARFQKALQKIAKQHPGEKVLLVSHGACIAAYFCYANKLSMNEVGNNIPENASPSVFKVVIDQ